MKDTPAVRYALIWNVLRWDLALQVHIARTERGWSIGELAERSGCPGRIIQAIENGNCKRVTLTHLAKLAGAFDVAVAVRFVPWSTFRATIYLTQ